MPLDHRQRAQLSAGRGPGWPEYLKVVALATDRAGYGALSRLISRARRARPKGSYALERADLENALARMLDHLAAAHGQAALPRQEQDGRWLRERFAGRLWIGVELADRRLRCAALGAARDTGQDAASCRCVAGGRCAHASAQPPRLAGCADGDSPRKCPCMPQATPCIPNGERCLRSLQRLRELYPAALLAQTLGDRGALHFQPR